MEAVKILSWTIALIVAVVLIARQTTKAMILRKVGLDDGFILLAAVSKSTIDQTLKLMKTGICHQLIRHNTRTRSRQP